MVALVVNWKLAGIYFRKGSHDDHSNIESDLENRLRQQSILQGCLGKQKSCGTGAVERVM